METLEERSETHSLNDSGEEETKPVVKTCGAAQLCRAFGAIKVWTLVWSVFCLLLFAGTVLGFIDVETLERLKPTLIALAHRNVTENA